MSSREEDPVELVDHAGVAVGEATVAVAHQAPGLAHRAFSVLLVDAGGRVLLQRRAAGKTRFPLLWSNSCCGHPAPGEAPAVAATRRVAEELRLVAPPLTEAGTFRYRASDQATGRVEHEHDHVLVGHLAGPVALDPDPAEVAECAWLPVPALHAMLTAAPFEYTPWLAQVLETSGLITRR